MLNNKHESSHNEDITSNAILILKELKYSYVDSFCLDRAILKIYKQEYDDSTRYGLTKCITDFVNMSGGLAFSINATYKDRLLTGISKRKTRLEFGDILALYNGKIIIIEVKKKENYAKHMRSKIRHEIEKKGELYINANNFQDFYEWFCEKIK